VPKRYTGIWEPVNSNAMESKDMNLVNVMGGS